MDKFLKEYKWHRFEDAGSVCSNDFKSFARKFKGYLQRNLPSCYSIKGHRCGHYDLSGFVERNGKYAYYSWSWNRYSDLDTREGTNPQMAVLYRTATDDKDFHGGFNHFCSIESLPEKILEVL